MKMAFFIDPILSYTRKKKGSAIGKAMKYGIPLTGAAGLAYMYKKHKDKQLVKKASSILLGMCKVGMGLGNKYNEILKPNQDAQDAGPTGADMHMSTYPEVKNAPSRPPMNYNPKPNPNPYPEPNFNYTPDPKSLAEAARQGGKPPIPIPAVNNTLNKNPVLGPSNPNVNSTLATPSMPTTGGFMR